MNIVAEKNMALPSIAASARDPIEVARAWLDEYGKAALATPTGNRKKANG